MRESAAKVVALTEIDQFVGKRPIDSIAPAEWEKLGRSMLLTEHNLRQPNAATRYQVFEEFLQREWREHGRRPRLHKWRTTLSIPQSVFLPQVIDVSNRLNRLRQAMDRVFNELPWPVSHGLAGAVAALDLCLFGRVSALKVIEALATADKARIRMVIFEQRAYIEFSEWMAQLDSAPVQRYLLPTRSARFADLALSAAKTPATDGKCLPPLQFVVETAGLSSQAGTTMHQLVRLLTQEIAQENAVLLPGIVGGLLAGRVSSAALPWADWVRARSGQARIDPNATAQAVQGDDHHPTEQIISPRSMMGVASASDKERSKTANQAFLGQIRSVLSGYLDSKTQSRPTSEGASTRNKRTNTDTAARRDARSRIERLLEKPDRAVSVTVFALGAWVLHLLYRPYRKGLLDAASIKRYMDTLSHGFVSFGYRLDLADLDGDELTEFYRCVLDGLDTGSDEKTDDEALDTRGKSNRQRNEKYVLQRLEEFHRFAAQRFGLEAPDWAEIGDGVISSLSNPGTITEQEYLHALQQLCPEPFEGAASSTRDAFVLMLVFRFGLRGGEAIGLRWNDWIDISGAVVVLVSSRYRQLKTRGSQRQVPLLEKLTDHELLIIRRWQAYWSTESGNTESVPLFFDEGDRNQVTSLQPVRSRILTAVRSATGNTGTTLHHARHAFANRLFEYLVHRNSNQIWAFHQSQDEVVASSARQSLLATQRPTRRTSWAIARLLGHVTQSTTFGSYLHIQFDWAAQCVSSSTEHRFTDVQLKKLRSATNIDTWAVEPRNLHTPIKIETDYFEKCTPTRALKFCRLRAQGLPARLAGEQCQLRQENWKTIEDALCLTGRKLASSGLEMDDTISSLTLPMVLLGRIHRKRWQTLIDCIETQEEGLPTPKTNFSEPIGQQIGKSRQLLLWSKNHFDQLRQFMEWMGIQVDHLDLYRPARVDARIISWADMVGFSKLKETHPKKSKKAFQLDVATEDKVGAPAVVHPHRLAAVSNSANQIFQDNYEFLLVWLAFSIGQASVNSDGTSIL